MTRVLVDSNVFLDVATGDPIWGPASQAALADLIDGGGIVINPIIYAEVSVGYASPDALDRLLATLGVSREPLSWDAAFLAGKAFLKYRNRGGQKRSPLPDFFIGAHAAISGYPLLTRDPAPYRTYFPEVRLVRPEKLQ